MRISIEEIVGKAVLNEKLVAEEHIKALSSECHYEQNRSYDPYMNAIVITDVYHIPTELLEKCYGKKQKRNFRYDDIGKKVTRMSKQDIIDALATLSVFASPFATLILLKIIL